MVRNWYRKALSPQQGRSKGSRGLRGRLRLERLEDRICPATYDYTVIANTAGGPMTSLSAPSINTAGQVAFTGTFADGSDSIFVGNGTSALNEVSASLRDPNRLIGPSVQINDGGQIVAVDRFAGSPPSYYLRTWDSSTDTYQVIDQSGSATGFDSFFNTVSISNDGGVAYIGKLTGANTVILNRNGSPISSLPSPQPYLRPMIANGGLVVARADHVTTNPAQNPIELFKPGQSATVIASMPNFSALGASPGISDDGQIVAFYGVLTAAGATTINAAQSGQTPLTAGPGIFLSISTASHGRILVRVAGETGSGILPPGETFLDANHNGQLDPGETEVGISQFDPDQRVAVDAIQGSDHAVTVVFMGTDSTTGNDGLWCNRVDFFAAAGTSFNPADPQSFRVNTDTLIAEVGDTIDGVPGTIQSLNIYDPINSKAQVAFQVSMSGGANAVVVANPIPVLAVTRLDQVNPAWASQEYAGGGTNPDTGQMYTIKNSGCALSDLAAALNYAGFPNLSYYGYPFTPLTLNGLLVTNKGYSGHGIVFDNDTDIAAENSGVPGLYFHDDIAGSKSVADLTALLQLHVPVIVQVTDDNGSHYVVVTGFSGGQFTIVDPGFYRSTTLAAYDNDFTIRGYISDPTDVSDLVVTVVGAGDGADVMVTNQQGQQTGTDAGTGNTTETIPQSVTYRDSPEDDLTGETHAETMQTVSIDQPQAGNYAFSVTGATAEPYTVYVYPILPDGSRLAPEIMTGTVTPGTPSTFQYTYDTGSQLPRLSIADVTQVEPPSGSTGTFAFTVSLSSQPTQTVTLDYATADNTATAGNDYQATQGTLTFTPGGALSQTIAVPVNGNTTYGPDTTFSVNLTNVTNAAMTKTVGVGTIENDNASISINNVSQYEGVGGTTPYVFTVSLAGPSSLPISVDYATGDGSATQADGDYKGQAGTLTFNPGQTTQTITISVPGDPTTHGDVSFFVTLANPVNGVLVTNAQQGIGTSQGDSGGTSYYVNDASTVGDVYCTAPGNDANDGKTPATPVASLTGLLALYTFHPGDTIYVDTGAYALVKNITLGTQYSGIRIVGPGPRQVTPSLTAATVLADQPIAYWRLGDTSGTTAVDATGNGYDGTYSDPVTHTLAAPSDDGAAVFDGKDDFVTVPDARRWTRRSSPLKPGSTTRAIRPRVPRSYKSRLTAGPLTAGRTTAGTWVSGETVCCISMPGMLARIFSPRQRFLSVSGPRWLAPLMGALRPFM